MGDKSTSVAALDGNSTAASQTIDELLTSAAWVTSLTDPALHLDRLHETFTRVIFSCVDVEEGNEPARRLVTAAERLREEREKEELRRELRELQDNTFVDDEDEDVGGLDEGSKLEDDHYTDEEFSEASVLMNDGEFFEWIHRNDTQTLEQRADVVDETGLSGVGIELELQRVGLSEEDRKVTEDILPERLKAIEVGEQRHHLGSRLLPHGYSYRIPIESEAFWVLCQLRGAGQPLAHNTRICALAARSPSEVSDEPVVVAIAYALRKMTREFLEPGHLMLYHQTPLHPLLCALLESSPLVDSAERTLPVASYAYSTLTGRRQRPYISDMYVGFSSRGDRHSIGEGDPAWERATLHADSNINESLDPHSDVEEVDFAQRKPCFIELGRLLVRILELDVLCHRLEWQRRQFLLKMKDSSKPAVRKQCQLLSKIVFGSVVEADFWQTYVSFITSTNGRGSTQAIRKLGLEEAFEEYTISGVQYQENLIANYPIRLCSSSHRETLMEWARKVSSSTSSLRSAEAVLLLFNQAIVEQFSRLPILRKRLFDLFCAEGDLIVTYKDCGRQDDIYPIASFFAEHARHYLELLERERQGSLELFYVINDDLVRGAVDFKRLYDCSFKGGNDLQNEDEWSVSREGAMNLLLMRLVDGLVPKVKGELGQFANRRVQAQSVERLGLLCAQGPYEATRLCLSAYDKDSLLWEPEWNIVEALPEQREKVSLVHSYGRRPAARVCAVYRGEGGVASISFIDEDGTFISSMRWADCELSSESGRVADEEQKNQFEKIFEHCNPNVIAVGAANISSLSLMQSIMRFVRERVYAKRHIHVPVVWAPVEVARLYSSTAYAEQETPNTDHVLRVSLALARYVQDPLSALVVLFDKGRTALRLSLGSVVNTSEQEAQLYARLCWEMSLWVTACGVWVDDCATRVHYASLLQFVAGVGPTRARKLQQILTSERPTSREACYQLIVSCFGEHVARNAACALRIGPVVDNGGTTTLFPSSSLPSEFRWQMMDQTLVPTSWYAVAALIARVGLKQKIPASLSSMPLMDSGVVALANFMGRSAQEKRASFDLHANQKDILLVIRAAQNPEWNSLLGEREVEFIQEEMISAGRSFMRRPYRRLSSRELMFCLTGITFCSKRDAAYGHRPMDSQSLYIYEGDYVTGTVQGLRGAGMGNVSGSPSIRVMTSRGIGAVISADDIGDSRMKQDLLEYEMSVGGRLQGLGDNKARGPPPDWLRRDALIQGIVIGCNWERCELRLRWCRPRDPEKSFNSNDTHHAKGNASGLVTVAENDDDENNYVSYAARGVPVPSCATSLRTVRLDMDVRVFATKVSRHPLFRDASSSMALKFLQDKKIGEVLLRPVVGRRSKVIAVVKIGDRSMCNWLVSEERRPNGAIYYLMTDKVTRRSTEYNDVDEFLNNFIAPMVTLVQGIRSHRRFVDNVRNVSEALGMQRRNNAKDGEVSSGGAAVFAYAFVEVGQQSIPPFYRVFTRAGTTERNYYLHIDDSSIYVRVPVRRSNTSGDVSVKWVNCRNAEHVGEVVKRLAEAR
ncbi:Holliday junction resolvase like of SPT6 SH2 domain [Trypanosoma vivax]|nr:transcription elongation factor SPT6 [Trypanosoma vivax]KAH8615893.1 Holliday junction resolvase like of SPT6 SH2 domain [Trypanosoma vivax]